MKISNGTEEAALKRQILKEEYPKNLIMAILDSAEVPISDFTADIIAGINYAVSTLDEREQVLIRLRYCEKKTLAQIGEHFGFKQERSRQIEVRALRKLRTPLCWNYITLGVNGFAKKLSDHAYEQGHQVGYSEGYQQGLEDAPKGITKTGFSINVLSLPIECLGLSKRAYNALMRAEYHVLGDITELDFHDIIHIKNLGVDQRCEIAVGLKKYGLFPTEWDYWLEPKKKLNEENE